VRQAPAPPASPQPRPAAEIGPYRRFLALVSLLIPARLRRDWRREWEAELTWRARQSTPPRSHQPSDSDAPTRPPLLSPALGALADALWLRKEEWRRDMILQDARYALRTLLRRPGFATVVILTLALGIGANTAIFTLIDGVLLRPLPYEQPERLVRIWGRNDFFGSEQTNINYLDLLDWRASTALPDIAAVNVSDITLHGEGDPQQIVHGLGTANLFDVLGVEPILGRTFAPGEDQPGNHRVVVLSYAFWSSTFGADPGVIGDEIRLGGDSFTIIGVLPADFRNPTLFVAESQPLLWRPVPYDVNDMGRGGHFLRAIGRLAPGATVEQAQQELDAITTRLAETYPDTNNGWFTALQPLRDSIVGDVRPTLLLLMGAVGILVLIACTNVANLLLARGLARRRELAVRAALGAGRTRLVRQLITESLLLAAAGGALGLAAATSLMRWLLAGSAAQLAPEGLGIDLRVLGFAVLLSLATGIAFGALPSLRATRLAEASSAGSDRSGGDRRQQRWRDGLVVAEVALSMVLLVGAGLVAKSYWLLHRVDPGLDPAGLLTLRVTLPDSTYPEFADRGAFFARLDESLQGLPGVRDFGAISILPFGGGYSCDSFGLEDRPAPAPGEEPCAEIRFTRGDYFAAMGIDLLDGRTFTASDDAQAPAVIVVNRTFADTWWPQGDALGKRFKYGSRDAEGPWRTIVGVVDDVHHFGLAEAPPAEVYFPHPQYPSRGLTYALRVDGDAAGIVGAVRSRVSEIDPELPVHDVATMEQLIAGSLAAERLRSLLLATFAATAVLLAIVGLYSVLATAVSQRHQEFGVRVALGARAGDVLGLVMRRGLLLTAAGILIGLLGALALTGGMRSLLFEVSPSDPATFGAVALLLLAIAALACWVPARRATRVDPVLALRRD